MTLSKDDISLRVTVGSVTLRNPFMVASGPTTKSVEQLVKAEEFGWGGAAIKLTFDPYPYINKEPRYGYWVDHGFLAFSAEKRLAMDEGLELVREGRKATKELKIFANITYEGEKGLAGWTNMAKRFEDAGAHGIELNMCCPNMSFNVEISGNVPIEERTGASLGQQADAVARIVEAVKKAVTIPVMVKITPEGGRVAQVALASLQAGADAAGPNANRLAIPPFDVENPEAPIYHLQDEPSMSCFCGSWLKPLALRDIYETRKLAGPKYTLLASGGCRNWKDAVEFFMCGTDIMQICTETLLSGFGFMPELIKGLKDYLARHGHRHPREIRDFLVNRITPAPDLTIYPGHARVKECNLAAPCKADCPNSVPAQAYVVAVSKGNYEEAFRHITSRDPLQSVCGYICNHPCETECTRGEVDEPIRIREIKRFALERAATEGWKRRYETKAEKTGRKVAVVGGGPAGLSAAFDLARAGHAVTVFEAEKRAGGMLRGVIPAFRLPERILKAELDGMKALGVRFETGKALGRDFSVSALKEAGFDAVCVAVGAAAGALLGVPGEDGVKGVVDALTFLRKAATGKAKVGRCVAVVGGGFTAVDAARTAVRLGAEDVFIVYRRTRDEMPATPEEVAEAEEEGVKVMYLVSPREVLKEDGYVTGLRMVNHVLGKKDASNRRRPEEVEGTEFTLRCDMVIPAIGQTVVLEKAGVPATKKATVAADDHTGKTRAKGVFAAGDCVTGPTSVISAVASGRRAAVAIDQFLMGRNAFLKPDPKFKAVDKAAVLLRIKELKREPRAAVGMRPASERRGDFDEYVKTFTEDEAKAEAARCLSCGCGAGCAICARLCSAFAISVEGDRIVLDEKKCHACGMCMALCPNRNIEIVKTSDKPIAQKV